MLGSRDDDNQFFPYKLDPRMFENNQAIMMGLGTQHAVCLARSDDTTPIPQLDLTITGLAAQEPVETVEQKAEPSQTQITEKLEAPVAAEPSGLEASSIPEPVPMSQTSKKRTLEEITPSLSQQNQQQEDQI